MTLIPHRTVASQLAALLRSEIAKGAWNTWLPGERALSNKVQASRNTVRLALEQLKAEGVIESIHGVGNRIVSLPSEQPASETQIRSVGVLVPEPIGRLRPLIALWIDELKDLLLEEGCRLRVHVAQQAYRTNPGRSLERLVEQNRHEAWILTLSSEPMQEWFEKHQIPCLVAGSTYNSIALPSQDLDYRAVCRHAAGVFIRSGHKRLAFLNRETKRAGDLDSELGFLEGVKSSPSTDITTDIAYHSDDVASVAKALRRVIERSEPSTAILVSNSYAYVSVASLLAQRGLRIPQDISLISRDDDPFLASIVPTPCRYIASPHSFAKKMLGPLLRLVAKEQIGRSPSRFLPKYSPGGSVASPSKTLPTR